MDNWLFVHRWFGWVNRIPIIGQLLFVFWGSIAAGDDVVDAMTFSFLNDGIKPTVWHTVYQVTHDNMAEFSGIYTKGAPRNEKEAKKKVYV